MGPAWISSALVALVVLGCGSAGTLDEGGSGASGGGGSGGGACTPGERSVDDVCQPAGVPADSCGFGFAPDGASGCTAVLPDEPCPSGMMALPGETRCRPVAPCDDGRWGTIPVEPDTQYVDAAYAGADSDGSADRPWTSVAAAVAAASTGAMVAITDGVYAEQIEITKPVRLWGRCPESVEIGGANGPALVVHLGASSTEIHDIGLSDAVGVLGAESVLLDRVWVHDSHDFGVVGIDLEGPVQLDVRRSLVERTAGFGVIAIGARMMLEDSVVRDTSPNTESESGRGVEIEVGNTYPAEVTVARCLVERSTSVGITVASATARIEDTLIREVAPFPPTQALGRGLSIQGEYGRSNVEVRGSVIEQVHEVGLAVVGSTVTVETTVIREVIPRPREGTGGHGLLVQYDSRNGERAELALRASLVEATHAAGVVVTASDAQIESTRVRDTRALPDGRLGMGLLLQNDPPTNDPATSSTAALRWSLVEDSRLGGVTVIGSDVAMEATAVERTTPQEADGGFGDGVVVVGGDVPGSIDVQACLIARSARAGIACFGASAQVADSTFECNGLHLDSELLGTASGPHESSFLDLGGNVCRCDSTGECVVQSANLMAPSALGR